MQRKGPMHTIISYVTGLLSSLRWDVHRDEHGASLVEYALLLALIAVIAILALNFLGHTVSNTLNSVGSSLQ